MRADLVAGWLTGAAIASYSGRDVWPATTASPHGCILAASPPDSLAEWLVIQASCLDILADKTTRLTHRLSDNLALCWFCFREQPPSHR